MLNRVDKPKSFYIFTPQILEDLSDEELIFLYTNGKLKNFCDILSLNLNSKPYEKDSAYNTGMV